MPHLVSHRCDFAYPHRDRKFNKKERRDHIPPRTALATPRRIGVLAKTPICRYRFSDNCALVRVVSKENFDRNYFYRPWILPRSGIYPQQKLEVGSGYK